MEAGRIDPKLGNALTYAYSALANVMQADVAKEIVAHALERRARQVRFQRQELSARSVCGGQSRLRE
jgi:hypothetical protein